MKTLTLLRHAKAVPPGGGIEDHARPLSPRGHEDAAAVGEATHPPDLVLCSTSLRTRQTIADVAAAWRHQPEILYEPALYLSGPLVLLRRIEAVPDEVGSLWLVGHNPGLHELALILARHAAGADEAAELQERFPTAARATFKVHAGSWKKLGEAKRTLAEFARA